MNIAVFSDIHGNYQALKAILDDIKNNKIKEVVFLGDAIALGPSSNKCIELLRKENVKYVIGNHELYSIKGYSIDSDMSEEEIKHHKWVDSIIKVEDIEWLKKQHMTINLKILNKTITFLHFFHEKSNYPFKHLNIFNDGTYKEIFKSIDSDYVFFGHEHSEKYYEVNNKRFYGVGSSGCNYNNETFYHVIRIDNSGNLTYTKRIIEYDRIKFNNIMKNIEYPDKATVSKVFFGL